MSLILDALNRAEKERSEPVLAPQSQAAPVLDKGHSAPWVRTLLIVIIILVAAAIVLFTVAKPNTAAVAETAEKVIADAATAEPAPAPFLIAKQAVEPKPVALAPAPRATPPTAAQPSANTQARTIADLYAHREQTPGVNNPRPTRPADSSAVEQTVAVNAPAPASIQATPAQTQSSAADPVASAKTTPDRNSILQGIPLLAAMSPRLQQQVPSIEYSVHVYNEDDGSGAVKLNGQLRRIGSELAPGLRVIAILPDSVVLDLNGTQFRLAALNSWVNFQ